MRSRGGKYSSGCDEPYTRPPGIFGGNKSVKFGLLAMFACVLVIQIYDRILPKGPAGPINDVFRREPGKLVIIYGTGGPGADSLRVYALTVSRLWQKKLGHEILVYPDKEVGQEILKDYSLILYGPVQENSIARKIEDRLPFGFDSGAVRLGGETYADSRWRLVFTIPSPYNPKHYLLVYTAAEVGDVIGINFPGNPNFVYHDTTDYVLAQDEKIVRQGHFDKSDNSHWVLSR